MSQSILSQPIIIIVVTAVAILAIFIYLNYSNNNNDDKTPPKDQEGGAMNVSESELDNLSLTASADQVMSLAGVNQNDVNFASLSETNSPQNNKNVSDLNLDDLLPDANEKDWGDATVIVADSKLINVNRCMGAMTTKKSATRDFRGDIPIKKDSNMLWNCSPIEVSDLIGGNK